MEAGNEPSFHSFFELEGTCPHACAQPINDAGTDFTPRSPNAALRNGRLERRRRWRMMPGSQLVMGIGRQSGALGIHGGGDGAQACGSGDGVPRHNESVVVESFAQLLTVQSNGSACATRPQLRRWAEVLGRPETLQRTCIMHAESKSSLTVFSAPPGPIPNSFSTRRDLGFFKATLSVLQGHTHSASYICVRGSNCRLTLSELRRQHKFPLASGIGRLTEKILANVATRGELRVG